MSDADPNEVSTEIEQVFPDLMGRCLAADTVAAVAVACSGGPDSMALTAMLNDWARERSIDMTALIVDHGLRANSAEEAVQVREWLTDRGINAEILGQNSSETTGSPFKSNIQAEARVLRFDHLIRWCVAHGVNHLVLGHHLDDQAETFLLRLARGSGVDGLAAMRGRQIQIDKETGAAVVLMRPFLDWPKKALESVLSGKNWPSVDDPSNLDPRFSRVRWRQMAPSLAEMGLDADRLAKTAAQMARASDTLDNLTDTLCRQHAQIDEAGGWASVAAAVFDETEDEIALRLLGRLLCSVGGQPYRPRLTSLEAALSAVRVGDRINGLTLHGCQLVVKDGRVQVFRELAAIGDRESARPVQVWDGRFRLRLTGDLDGITIAPLGNAGWQVIRQAVHDATGVCEKFEQVKAMPALAREGAPAIWSDQLLVAAPSLGFFHLKDDVNSKKPLKVEECHLIVTPELRQSF